MVIVASFSIVDRKAALMTDPCDVIGYAEVEDYLGVSDASLSFSTIPPI
jgi:hypothetical protein